MLRTYRLNCPSAANAVYWVSLCENVTALCFSEIYHKERSDLDKVSIFDINKKNYNHKNFKITVMITITAIRTAVVI